MKNNNGISLIVSIITIIVIIILTGSVIINLSQNNPITQANEAKIKSDLRSFDQEFDLWLANEYISTDGKLDLSTVYSGTYKNKNGEEVTIQQMIPSIIGTDYEDKLKVQEAQLAYTGEDLDVINWANQQGIYPGLKVNIIAEDNMTVNGLSTSYNNPIVPKGFKALNTLLQVG